MVQVVVYFYNNKQNIPETKSINFTKNLFKIKITQVLWYIGNLSKKLPGYRVKPFSVHTPPPPPLQQQIMFILMNQKSDESTQNNRWLYF